jgi:hypothetical protein
MDGKPNRPRGFGSIFLPTMTDLEATRARYAPKRLRVLFLGESPPPIRGFFYTGDSTLFTHTSAVMVHRCSMPTAPERFLRAFQAAGFFLDDYSSKTWSSASPYSK